MILNPTLILIAGGGLAFILLIVGIVTSISTEKSQVEERLGRYTEKERQTIEKQAYNPFSDWVNRRVEKSSIGDQIAKSLARADIKMKPGEYFIMVILSGVIVAAIGWFIGAESLLLAIVGGIFGLFVPGIYVKRQQSQRLVRFNNQLGDMLNLMVNGLRAGYATVQALEAVSKELPPPISEEFRRVVQEMQLGISMDQALENLLRRIPSDDLDLVITAINVQREVGGNLAEILDTISYTIRERVRLFGEIRVLTSQVMYSGRFLSLMPIIVILILYVLNRPYMMEFFLPENVPCGYISLAVAGLMILSGYFAMNKLAKIEV
ncbi:MAG: type II secretion system F family protein [Anaerolineaceae bacterium]|jgi:tight adherence protein B